MLDLYRGEFLQGFYLHQAVHFEEWVLAQREEARLLTLRGLEALVEERLPISLDAQAGLAYLIALRANAGQPRLAARSNTTKQVIPVLRTVYRHPAATQETRTRVAKLAAGLGVSVNLHPRR